MPPISRGPSFGPGSADQAPTGICGVSSRSYPSNHSPRVVVEGAAREHRLLVLDRRHPPALSTICIIVGSIHSGRSARPVVVARRDADLVHHLVELVRVVPGRAAPPRRAQPKSAKARAAASAMRRTSGSTGACQVGLQATRSPFRSPSQAARKSGGRASIESGSRASGPAMTRAASPRPGPSGSSGRCASAPPQKSAPAVRHPPERRLQPEDAAERRPGSASTRRRPSRGRRARGRPPPPRRPRPTRRRRCGRASRGSCRGRRGSCRTCPCSRSAACWSCRAARPRRANAPGRDAVLGRDVLLEPLGAVGGADAGGRLEILDRVRDAVHWAAQFARGAPRPRRLAPAPAPGPAVTVRNALRVGLSRSIRSSAASVTSTGDSFFGAVQSAEFGRPACRQRSVAFIRASWW